MLHFANEAEKRVVFLPQDTKELTDYFTKNPDATLIIDFDSYFDFRHQKDLLKNVQTIPYKKVLLIGNGSHNYNLESLKSNGNLNELHDKYSELAYDFTRFPNLETLIYLYVNGSRNYSSLSRLKELSLWSYPKKDINEFLPLANLEELRFVQSKIHTLKGISQFKKLKSIFLIANRSLEFNIGDDVSESVTELYIDRCKKIDADVISSLFPNLNKLTIMQNGEIEQLKYLLDNLKYLRRLNLMGTKILESDNRYWKNYPVSIDFLNQKNLLLKPDEFSRS